MVWSASPADGRTVATGIAVLAWTIASVFALRGLSLRPVIHTAFQPHIALLGIAAPALLRSTAALRTGLLVLAASLSLMPLTHDSGAWWALRLIAGAASALVFMIATSAMLAGLAAHMTGWAFGGVGAGIALSGLMVVAVQQAGSWQTAWFACAVLTVLLTVAAWNLVPRGAAATAPAATAAAERPRTHRWFTALLTSYVLEGIGYIIAGTFLVAALQQGAPGWIGSGAWIVVGLAALPSCAVWMRLARLHRTHETPGHNHNLRSLPNPGCLCVLSSPMGREGLGFSLVGDHDAPHVVGQAAFQAPLRFLRRLTLREFALVVRVSG
nr:YbfB/YjiJ family MFS transporter [Streptomyces sp. SID5469]